MSVAYHPVGWTRSKIVYDAVLLAGVAIYLLCFLRFAPRVRAPGTLLDDQSLAIKAYGSCAFILLSLVLMIGPLARLDLAAGEFPQARQLLALGTLGDQHAAVRIDQGDGDDQDGGNRRLAHER